MAMLEIGGLAKRFGDKEVLRNVSLTVPEGSIYGFIGRNGAGKTTTMKAILGLVKPDSGTIQVAGEVVRYGETTTNRHIGYLPDVPSFYPFMTAAEYLRFSGEMSGLDHATIRRRSEALLSLVGLENERHRIKGYSRGMKQRLGIAQALLHAPKLLICDEPTSALDPIGRKEILDILQNVRHETTVLFSTHILSDVERICTDIAFLNDGVIAREGTLDTLRNAHTSTCYTLVLGSAEAARFIAGYLPALEATNDDAFIFDDGTLPLEDVIGAISQYHLPLVRLEREEPSLESLFMEVTGA